MKEIKLTNRLETVAQFVPEHARLVDVGTDHAYLPVYLYLNNWVDSVIATDIRSGPLEHAKRTAQEYQCDSISFVLCDGLMGVDPGTVDTITISGMGGETIVGILEAAIWARNCTLILQPQSTQNVLRHFLAEKGFVIVKEKVAREGNRWYPVIVTCYGNPYSLSPAEEVVGVPNTWIDQNERFEYLCWVKKQLEAQIMGLEKSSKKDDSARREYLKSALAELMMWVQE